MSATSFTAALAAFVESVVKNGATALSMNQKAAQTVAIGWLSRKSKTEINAEAKEAITSAAGDDAWKSGKVPLSRAWRAIGGEYGFGEPLARQWAAGDFSVNLLDAYAASAGPRKVTDKIASALKLLVNMSPEEREIVAEKLQEILENQEKAAENRLARGVALGIIKPENVQKVA